MNKLNEVYVVVRDYINWEDYESNEAGIDGAFIDRQKAVEQVKEVYEEELENMKDYIINGIIDEAYGYAEIKTSVGDIVISISTTKLN